MGFSTFPNNPFPPSSAQFDDVNTALATKTNLSNIAPSFDATSGVYAVGDKVIYNGVLYEFTSAHSTAGEWDESEVQPVKISELIDSLKSGLISKIEQITVGKVTGATFADFILGVLGVINIGNGKLTIVYAVYPNNDYYVFNVLRLHDDVYMFTANNTTDMFHGRAITGTNYVDVYKVTSQLVTN